MRPGVEEREEAIIDAVIGLLRTEGYDAVQVRRVATEASVSLATMYKLFGTLDELILRAVEAWMAEHSYAALPEPTPESTPYETLSAIVHALFEPWQREPQMLHAFIRASMTPAGGRLRLEAFAIIESVADQVLADFDPAFVDDLRLIGDSVALAALTRFSLGEISASEILPIMDRTLRRLLPDDPQGP